MELKEMKEYFEENGDLAVAARLASERMEAAPTDDELAALYKTTMVELDHHANVMAEVITQSDPSPVEVGEAYLIGLLVGITYQEMKEKKS